MMRPIIARQSTQQRFVQQDASAKKNDKAGGEQAVSDIQSSIADSVEELGMARSKYQSKNKKNDQVAEDLGRMLQSDPESQEALTKVLGQENVSRDSLEQILSQVKSDVNKYQLMRFLLANADISAASYQFLFEEMEKLKRKRKKLASLDNIDSETLEMSEKESISASQLQEIFLSFLEYEGHISPYYDDVYKQSKKKYKKIIKFISQMMNYEIYALTTKDDIDTFIFMTEKRRALNMMNEVYEKLESMSIFDDLEFVHSLLNNIDVEEFCNKISAEQASRLVTFFNRIPQELFFSIEDKDEMIGTLKNNITYRFKRQWIGAENHGSK